MVIYPRYRLYPITPDTPIDPNNQHIIFSNIPFYQVISPLYPQLNHHGCFCGWVFTILPCFFVWLHRWIPYTTILPGGILRTFPYSPWILHIFPIFFCIVLVFKYIYINIILFLLHFPYIPWSYHIFHIYIYTHILHIFLIQRFFKPSTNHISKARQWLVIRPSCLVDIFEAKFQVFAPQRFWVAKKLLALVDGHWIAASLWKWYLINHHLWLASLYLSFVLFSKGYGITCDLLYFFVFFFYFFRWCPQLFTSWAKGDGLK